MGPLLWPCEKWSSLGAADRESLRVGPLVAPRESVHLGCSGLGVTPRHPQSSPKFKKYNTLRMATLPDDWCRVTLVGPVSAHCDWLKQRDLQLLSQSGGTDNCLSRSIPEICFACCWNVKQLRYISLSERNINHQLVI